MKKTAPKETKLDLYLEYQTARNNLAKFQKMHAIATSESIEITPKLLKAIKAELKLNEEKLEAANTACFGRKS